MVLKEDWALSVNTFLAVFGAAQRLYGTGAVDAYVRGTFAHGTITTFITDYEPFIKVRHTIRGKLLMIQVGDQQLPYLPLGRFEFRLVKAR